MDTICRFNHGGTIVNYKDDVTLVSGWWHNFVCPDCQTMLLFVWDDGQYKTGRFTCPHCGGTVSEEKYRDAWVYMNRRMASEHLDQFIVKVRNGDEGEKAALLSLIDYYADHYDEFPVHGDHVGKGRIQGQSLDEAVFGIRLIRAVYLCKDNIPAGTLKRWEEKLFRPMAELLRTQGMRIHNISIWIWCYVALFGIVYGDSLLAEEAVSGEYGLRQQMNHGLTEDRFWREGSLHYHYYALEGLSFFFEIAYSEERELDLCNQILSMMKAPLVFLQKGLRLPALNDGWYPTLLSDYAEQFFRIAAVSGNEELAGVCGEIIKERPEINQKDFWNYYRDRIVPPADRKKNSGSVLKRMQAWMKTVCFSDKANSGCTLHMDKHIGKMETPFFCILKSGSLERSHMHRDYLSVIIPGFSDDLGTSGYGTKMNEVWYRDSLAHCSISVDGKQPRRLMKSYADADENTLFAAIEAGQWDDITSMQRRLQNRKTGILDETSIRAEKQHRYEWVFHCVGRAEYNCEGTEVSSLGVKGGYVFFREILKMNTRGDFTARFKTENNSVLEITIPVSDDVELFTAKTPGMPADELRNTILVRKTGKDARFQAFYAISKEKL